MSASSSHFDESGAARMVDVSDKAPTRRLATAQAHVRMAAETLDMIEQGRLGKGDVLAVARHGAIAGAKHVSAVIPLCHPISVTGIDVEFDLDRALPGVVVRTTVRAVDRTGPEMEAMAAAAGGALTIYDMCKSVDRGMVLESVRLLAKSGGKSGDWVADA